MNGLALRITKGGTSKVKNSCGFSAITLPEQETYVVSKEPYKSIFANSSTAESQLGSLRDYLTQSDLLVNEDLIEFLVSVFLYSEAKNPVKCFLTRHITKTIALQEPFVKSLSVKLKILLKDEHANYQPYVNVVTKLLSCTENFPAGAEALRVIEELLVEYLAEGLVCSQEILREKKSLSPTEKNEIFNLEHSILRLLLHIVQKTSNITKLDSKFYRIRLCVEQLYFDCDVPMDTKSVGGILYLTLHLMENGPDSWIDMLQTQSNDASLSKLLTNESAQLALSSAIATIVSVDRLDTDVGGENGLIKLTSHILAIGERTATDSTFTLGVARTVVQLSRLLNKPGGTGAVLADHLLSFTWSHLEHHMDSVRHLSAQVLGLIVKYYVVLSENGDPSPMDKLCTYMRSMDKSRKSFYVVLSEVARAGTARELLSRDPGIVRDILHCLHLQPVQTSATNALEILLTKHSKETSSDVIYQQWVLPVLEHVTRQEVDSTALNAYEHLLTTAVRLDKHVIEYILPHIKEASDPTSKQYNLKCVLMLLSVCRKLNVTSQLSTSDDNEWRGVISYDVLKLAAVSDIDETRILCLSLIVESSKSTEIFTYGELQLILYFLKYNINAQSPNFRQLTLSLLKKFIKRFEDSHKVLQRQKRPNCIDNKSEYYLSFMGDLCEVCFESVIEGANYSRRYVALQILVWCGRIDINGYEMKWNEDYIEKLLLHLEDSYENNKTFALEILERCPEQLIKSKTYSISMEIEEILKQASSVKPTDCISAAYKLDLLRKKIPESIIDNDIRNNIPELVFYKLINKLLCKLEAEVIICEDCVVQAARCAPMYGILHCITHCMQQLNTKLISSCHHWTSLVSSLISICARISTSVASVVNNDSPEGHLPCDMNSVQVYDTGNSGGVTLEDGRQVTAQMVLLCAWRSVKEVSLLLGVISSRLSIEGEGDSSGNVRAGQLIAIGEHFTKLLAETKHRGAFEQAYVGFTMLLTRLWRCSGETLHALPSRWLNELVKSVASGDKTNTGLCATRRSAGLPFMIQALVTTELQVHTNPKCFHHCISTLLQLAKIHPTNRQDAQNNPNDMKTSQNNDLKTNETENLQIDIETNDKTTETNTKERKNFLNNTEICQKTSELNTKGPKNISNDTKMYKVLAKEAAIETCTHSLNILRALFRNSSLDESVSGYVGEGLMVALTGFEGETWAVRNSSTLLLSALVSRVFGVSRRRHQVDTRNRMTGRIFFLRYPALYDFMLSKLQQVNSDSSMQVLRPSLYPILLILARLYPSSLEGTVSNLKLVAFVPHVLSCAGSAVLKTRQLAAQAILPLISPQQYIPHIEEMFKIICDRKTKKNYCHGILLQLIKLLDSRPDNLDIEEEAMLRFHAYIINSLWILQSECIRPCYLIIDEYVKVINLLIWRFPELITVNIMNDVQKSLQVIVSRKNSHEITSGRDVCLANTVFLYFVILNKTESKKVPEVILRSLKHDSYETLLSSLNYLLILYEKHELSNNFEEHLQEINKENVLEELRKDDRYLKTLNEVLKSNKYLEVKQKALKILTLEENTQKYILNVEFDDKINYIEIVNRLFEKIETEHDNFVHIYLESCVNFVSDKLKGNSIDARTVLDVLRLIFAHSSSENDDSTRMVVVGFLESNLKSLLSLNVGELSDGEKFEFKATLWSTASTLLEDDDLSIRQRTSNAICQLSNGHTNVIPSVASERVRCQLEREGDIATCVVLSLLDFKSEVCMNDEVSDECRVFDQNERYNVFLEETIWTNECAAIIKKYCKKEHISPKDYVMKLLENPAYKSTFAKLCNNLELFKHMLDNDCKRNRNDVTNPKLRLFARSLSK